MACTSGLSMPTLYDTAHPTCSHVTSDVDCSATAAQRDRDDDDSAHLTCFDKPYHSCPHHQPFNHTPAAPAFAGLASHQLLFTRAAQLAASGVVAADCHGELRAHCISKLHQLLTKAQQQWPHTAWHIHRHCTLNAVHIRATMRAPSAAACTCALPNVNSGGSS
jgi:hypothetical protein